MRFSMQITRPLDIMQADVPALGVIVALVIELPRIAVLPWAARAFRPNLLGLWCPCLLLPPCLKLMLHKVPSQQHRSGVLSPAVKSCIAI
jgi:hypothetical protein